MNLVFDVISTLVDILIAILAIIIEVQLHKKDKLENRKEKLEAEKAANARKAVKTSLEKDCKDLADLLEGTDMSDVAKNYDEMLKSIDEVATGGKFDGGTHNNFVDSCNLLIKKLTSILEGDEIESANNSIHQLCLTIYKNLGSLDNAYAYVNIVNKFTKESKEIVKSMYDLRDNVVYIINLVEAMKNTSSREELASYYNAYRNFAHNNLGEMLSLMNNNINDLKTDYELLSALTDTD